MGGKGSKPSGKTAGQAQRSYSGQDAGGWGSGGSWGLMSPGFWDAGALDPTLDIDPPGYDPIIAASESRRRLKLANEIAESLEGFRMGSEGGRELVVSMEQSQRGSLLDAEVEDREKSQTMAALAKGFNDFTRAVHQHPFLVAKYLKMGLLNRNHLRSIMYVEGTIGGHRIWLVIPGVAGRDLVTGKIYMSPGASEQFVQAFADAVKPNILPLMLRSQEVRERPFAHYLPSNARVITSNQLRGASLEDVLLMLLERPGFRLERVDFCILRHTDPQGLANPRAWETDQTYCFPQLDDLRKIYSGQIPERELQPGATWGTPFASMNNPTQALVTLKRPLLPHRAEQKVQLNAADYVQQLASLRNQRGRKGVSLDEFLRDEILQQYNSEPDAQPFADYYPPNQGGGMLPNPVRDISLQRRSPA